MATQPTSTSQQQESSFSTLPSLLGDAFNTGLGVFERWVDHELGLGEVALANESNAHALAIQADEAPAGSTALATGAQQFTLTTLLLVGGLGLVVFLLLRS